MLGNFIIHDGVPWALKAPGAEHYSGERRNGHLFLHANRECSGLNDPKVTLSPKIVQTLWEKDVASSTTAGENDVQWCEECATTKVD